MFRLSLNRPIYAIAIAALCPALMAGFALADGDKKPKATATDKADKAGKGAAKSDAAAEEEENASGLQAARFMPLGRPNLEVKIPQFEDGELQCVMNAVEMTRIDDQDIDIKEMDIEFMEDGEAVTRIELLDARYNFNDRLISTEKRAVVQRSDFTLVGETLEFDTIEQRGKMRGKVRMVIHDSSSFAGKKDEEEDKKDEEAEAEQGLSVAEAARMIARVAAFQQRHATAKPQNDR